jgi:hypothetical protein
MNHLLGGLTGTVGPEWELTLNSQVTDYNMYP